MTPDEVRDQLDQPGARELLASAPPGHLGYTGADGDPWTVPIGFLWTGSTVVVCTADTAPKVRAISARPAVAFAVDSGGTGDARSVLIRGSATVDIVDGVPDEYLAASAKGLDGEDQDRFEAAVREMYERMARITITPEWARFYDFGNGRIPRTLEKLADRA